MSKCLKRLKKELFHYKNSQRIEGENEDMIGNCSELRGDCSELRGDCSGLSGDCSGLGGDLDKITAEEREANSALDCYIEEVDSE